MLFVSVVVQKDLRGRGLGRKIMELTEEHARK